jgi:hypothetical protein
MVARASGFLVGSFLCPIDAYIAKYTWSFEQASLSAFPFFSGSRSIDVLFDDAGRTSRARGRSWPHRRLPRKPDLDEAADGFCPRRPVGLFLCPLIEGSKRIRLQSHDYLDAFSRWRRPATFLC